MFQKNKNSKDYIDVYWATYGEPENQFHRMMLDISPKKITGDLVKNKAVNPKIPNVHTIEPNGYQQCAALHNLANNMFVLKSPVNASVQINNSGEIIRNPNEPMWFTERISSLENAFSIDFNLAYLFFTDQEKLDMTLTPAYMHKTSYRNDAFLASVKFDISSWFRPVTFIYQMWEELNFFEIKENDALGYISFDTEKPIRFHQFTMSNTILHQVKACVDYKFFKKNTPMNQLYDLFKRTNMRNSIIQEIKKNVISG